MMCPMCGRALYLEGSTGDVVCVSCCGLVAGEHYVLLSLIGKSV